MSGKNNVNIEYLKEKSINSIIMAIEIFNKPTVEYRLEGCLFFLHNSWELLLKAKLLSDGQSIYYKDNKNTLSLKDSARKLMTNDKDPIRRNLDVIISYRNMATHLFIPEYDHSLLPFITFNVEAYANKLKEYFDININDRLTSDFLSLFTARPQTENINILGKYGSDVSESFNEKKAILKEAIDSAGESSIATTVEISIARINNKSKADYLFYQARKEGDGDPIRYVDRQLDPNTTHTLNHQKLNIEINKYIIEHDIPFTPIREPQQKPDGTYTPIFSTHALSLILKEYDLKNDAEFCYGFKNGNSIAYKYHPKIITKIISIISEDKDIVVKINKKR